MSSSFSKAMSGSTPTRYIHEMQFWFIAAAAGFILAAFSSSLLFIWLGLQVLGLTTNISQLGITGIGATLIASILLTKVIANRLLERGVVTITSVVLFFHRNFCILMILIR